MRVIHAKSVSDALSQGLHAIRIGHVAQPSRVGDVLVAPYPVMTVYHEPRNRVLFSPLRNANPFFHVMESLWMLAGRNDLPWLTQFNSRFSSYSDDGGQTQPGAYGYRWRQHFGYDQLETLIQELKQNPQTRRCVLAMWDGGQAYDFVENNLPKSDLCNAIGGSADVPCNTHAYFDTIDGKLNMTVCCRSNDIIWGAYGANAVHFSFLLEYVAAMTGLPMGVYRQFSNNFHVYTNVVPVEQLMPYARDAEKSDKYFTGQYADRGPVHPALRQPKLVQNPETFLQELSTFLDDSAQDWQIRGWYGGVGNPFFSYVAIPMFEAWQAYKAKDYRGAIDRANNIMADDWKFACVEWLTRRMLKAQANDRPFTEVTNATA